MPKPNISIKVVNGYVGEPKYISNPPYKYNTIMVSGTPMRNPEEFGQEHPWEKTPSFVQNQQGFQNPLEIYDAN